jgi:hypothetical protein
MDLQTATVEEIMEELFNRTTFVGVVVYSTQDHKTIDQMHSNFKVVTGMDADTTAALMQIALGQVQKG